MLTPFFVLAQSSMDTILIQKTLDEVSINALRANETTPIAFKNIEKENIEEHNIIKDIPYVISFSPSIVSTSDAGSGIGYTNFRLRGSDATRINITINGIPINDSESQGVWWVNMPDLASSLENIQIQRGVGTSTNGASAFGGTINLQTNKLREEPYAISNNSFGSFKSLKNNIQFGTGIIHNRFTMDGRISQIKSNGFIDRANSDLKSYFLSASYYGNDESLKLVSFHGKEKTYQAWYGVPLKFLEDKLLRTYNPYDYENEIDNYSQTHYQLHYNKQISSTSNINIATHYTHGEGYYEQYIGTENNLHLFYNTYSVFGDDLFSSYGLDNLVIGEDTISTTNLIRRKWLNNDFSGLTYSLNYELDNLNFSLGGASNRYEGQHYGKIIWSEYASNGKYNHQYYWNKSEKIDHNVYTKINYQKISSTNIYLDLQLRSLNYIFEGYDENGTPAEQKKELLFFNPKFGVQYNLNKKQIIYASFGIANREPNRNDYIDSEFGLYPKPETLHDYETGYKIVNSNISFSVNGFYMNYKNQLVATGKINNVGAYIRANVKESFRAGLEIEGKAKFSDKLNWISNVSISKNKIKKFTEYVDNWDSGSQEHITHTNTDIAFSPSLIWSSQFNYNLYKNIGIHINSKYVGKQYIDNTSSKERMLDNYLVTNLHVTYNWKNQLFSGTKITVQINNLLNTKYESNAWAYRFVSNNYDPTPYDPYVTRSNELGYNMIAYFPQAGRHYMIGINLIL